MASIFFFLSILPSLMLPWSMACPTGKIVLTKMPMDPLGESMPPTTLKPRPFRPGPFSNSTVRICIERDLGRRGIWEKKSRCKFIAKCSHKLLVSLSRHAPAALDGGRGLPRRQHPVPGVQRGGGSRGAHRLNNALVALRNYET